MSETVENRFNLVDEPWIPVADVGLVSLRKLFTDRSLRFLGGNPLQKIAITKLLLAIVQAAWTPEDETEWSNVGSEGMAQKALSYLEEKKELFWLYGERPFLQMPNIAKAARQNYGAVLPYIASGNSTVLKQSQIEKVVPDAEKAQLVVVQMGFATGGKKTDNSIVLSSEYKGKSKAGKPGVSLGYYGYLHSFLMGKDLFETLWLNMFTSNEIERIESFEKGLGIIPWEKMPEGEDCENARILRSSYFGRLIPFCRFLLLGDDYLHYSEGISHLTHKDGGFDPSITVDFGSAKPKAIWVDPEKRPWRQLPALLSFLNITDKKTFDCLQLRNCIPRARMNTEKFGIWAGGLMVSNKAGEQFVTGMDDFVESEILLYSKYIGAEWFALIKVELKMLDDLSSMLYAAINSYYRQLKSDGSNSAKKASNLFWQLCERNYEELVYACNDLTGVTSKAMRTIFADYINKSYNTYCPSDTARQLDAWAANRPNLKKFLTGN